MANVGGQQDWVGLGVAVRERREALDMTQDALYAAGGPSTVTQRNVESGRATGLKRRTVVKYERVLGWAAGSIDHVLQGRDWVLAVTDDEDGSAQRRNSSRPVGSASSDVRSAMETLRGLRSVMGESVFDAAVDLLYASVGQPYRSGHTERETEEG